MTRVVYVGWTPQAPTQALVLELRTHHPDGVRVDGVTISYQSGRRGYTAPFATNAQLIIGQQHHQAAQRTPVERSPMPAWPPLPRIRTRPA